MKKMKKSGFTVVEIIVVIVAISILATITVVSYAGVQKKARDTERESDVAVIKRSLDSYYQRVGSYPRRTEMHLFANEEKMEIPTSALRNPLANDTVTNSVEWNSGSDPTTSQYLYYSYNSAGSGCILAADTCVKYALTYRKETDNSVVQVKSKYGW